MVIRSAVRLPTETSGSNPSVLSSAPDISISSPSFSQTIRWIIKSPNKLPSTPSNSKSENVFETRLSRRELPLWVADRKKMLTVSSNKKSSKMDNGVNMRYRSSLPIFLGLGEEGEVDD